MIKEIMVFGIISTAYAAVYIDGPCPDIKAVVNFNLTAFIDSKWYEIARYQNDVEKKEDCLTLSFEKTKDKITFTLIGILNGKRTKMGGILVDPFNTANNGVLNYKSHNFEDSESTEIVPVYILAVDYNSYCIGYECKYNPTTNKGHVYAWVKSRTKTLEGDAKMAVDNFLQSHPNIDPKLFYWVKFDDATCNKI